jgi:hypothetical protein
METNRKIIGTPFTSKMPNEVSWTEENPKTSLDFIRETQLGNLPKNDIDAVVTVNWSIIYWKKDNITVLDISAKH